MSKKLKIVGGSLVGGACIHLALALISSCRPSTQLLPGSDHDGAALDASTAADSDTPTDTPRPPPDSVIDSAVAMVMDVVGDVAREVLDAETRDAVAQDASGTCTCPPPPVVPVPVFREQTSGVTTTGDNNWISVPNTALPVVVTDSGIIDIQAVGGVIVIGGSAAAACQLRVTVDGAGGGGDTAAFLSGAVFASPWSILRRATGLSAGTHTVELQISRIPGLGTGNCVMEGLTGLRTARLLVTPR